jgi:FkbM family methyltransferase
MDIRKIAIIFDDKIRPDTTGVYCQRALSELVEVHHFRPFELGQIPSHGFDLYLRIDDGLEYHLPSQLRPAAWWVIDTHLNLPWYLDSAPEFNWLFAAQRDAVEQFRNAGCEATWLPLACDPGIHRKHKVEKSLDVCFVGHLFDGHRADLVALIQKRFPISFVGQRFFDEMAQTYSMARTVFNRSIRNDVNMRFFEALACGSLLVTNDLAENGQEDLARDGVHLATYRDRDELVDKIAFYLKKGELRERLASAGRALALEQHTYRHRMEKLLGLVKPKPKATKTATLPPPRQSTTSAMTSIVILTHNQLAYTRQCLDSIRERTEQPYELIVVDNASTDGTVEYLRSQADIKLICNSENRGFPCGCNQGIGIATGGQILLLNNDTVVTSGWLARLLQTLNSDPKIGLAGPCSNCVSGDQEIPAHYQDLAGLESFAHHWAHKNAGGRKEVDRLVGFCLLMRREVVDRIGLLDERFGVGCFEDDDYCRRALQAGYRAVIARDAFIHHYGGLTFRGSGIDYGSLLQSNQRLFEAKWAKSMSASPSPAEADLPHITYGVQATPQGLRLVRKGKLISLCMIVRNNAGIIRACLESIKPWVDEMIVVDTGSTDDTPRIAAELGARVFHMPWPYSFSIARNESIRHARGRWIFWMDSDDTISEECGRRLRQLVLNETSPATFGYVMQVHCPGRGNDGADEITVVDHVKLFRNRPDLRFEHRIHEQILPAINRAGGTVEFTDIHVVHSGYDHSPEGQRRKLERDLDLLHRELEEMPRHPFTLFNLGMTYTDVKRYDEALEFLQQCLQFSHPGDSHVRKVYAYVVACHQGKSDMDRAAAACQEGLGLFPLDAELRFRNANLLHLRGQLAEAVAAYHDLFLRQEEAHYKSVVAGITGYLARHNLAVVYQDQGDFVRAEEQWRLIVGERPGYRPGWRGLGGSLLAQGKIAEVQKISKKLLHEKTTRAEGLLLEGQAAARNGDKAKAQNSWQQVVTGYPDQHDVLLLAGRLLFEHIEPPAAEAALRAALRCFPEDGATLHNLGAIFLQTGRTNEAVEAFTESLKHRPDSAQTQAQLGHALLAVGRGAEAVAAWKQALILEPNNAEALEFLRQVGQQTGASAGKLPAPPVAGPIASRFPMDTKAGDTKLRIRGPVDVAIARDLWDKDVYRLRTISTPPALVLDIGAHIGIFSLLAAHTWPSARIIACEADPENAIVLRQNVAARPGIETVEGAIVAEDVTKVAFHAVMDKIGGNSGGSSCVRLDAGTKVIEIPALSVVRLWDSKRIQRCDLLKLDCEGAELSILRALAKAGLLSRVRHVTGEWHAADEAPATTAKIRAQLAGVLEKTHHVTFAEPIRGREGHFLASSRVWPPT